MAKKSKEFAEKVRTLCEKWRAYFNANNTQYHAITNFTLGRQWTDDEDDMLKSFRKVPLQFNKLATLVNTLLGEQQQNTPQIEVVPTGNCDEETAQIRQIVTKDIMLSTDAKAVYQNAAKQAFVGGYGAFCIDTDYQYEDSFDQQIVYRPLKDPTLAWWDVSAEHPNKIDGMHCGYLSRMSRQKFKELYGEEVEEDITGDKDSKVFASKSEVAAAVETNSKDGNFKWADKDGITINHYYYRKYKPVKLYKLSNGRAVEEDELKEIIEKSQDRRAQMQEMQMQSLEMQMSGMGNEEQMMPNPPMFEDDDRLALYDGDELVSIEGEKDIKKSSIMYCQIAGDYILEEGEFPAEDLPLIFVDQNSFYDENGKQVCRPFIIDAIDSQRYLNYLGTQAAFILKISRYDQFIASKKNVQGADTKQIWSDPNSVQGALIYDESTSGAKPEQLRPPELSQSLLQQYQRAQEDMYTCTGLYPTRLGQEGNEVSGKAIDARARQGSYPTYVAFNAINSAITAGGTVINKMIPKVYDTQRVMNLMTPDRGRQVITVNQQMDEYGEVIKNDIRKGTYQVVLQAGPSYEGQKQESLNSLAMILQSNPALFNMIADLFAENLPLQNTIEIKNRLKTLVPKEILEAGKSGEMPEKASQPSAQDQAAMAEVEFKRQQIELKKQELQIKMREQEAKIEAAKLELQMKSLEMAAELESQQLRYMAETDRTRSDNAISHADNLTKILINAAKERNNNADRVS